MAPNVVIDIFSIIMLLLLINYIHFLFTHNS